MWDKQFQLMEKINSESRGRHTYSIWSPVRDLSDIPFSFSLLSLWKLCLIFCQWFTGLQKIPAELEKKLSLFLQKPVVSLNGSSHFPRLESLQILLWGMFALVLVFTGMAPLLWRFYWHPCVEHVYIGTTVIPLSPLLSPKALSVCDIPLSFYHPSGLIKQRG